MRFNLKPIKPKKEFYIKKYKYKDRPTEKVYIVFDGDEILFDVKVENLIGMRYHEKMIKECETYLIFETFETRKGNKFIHCYDYETDEHYLVKVEEKEDEKSNKKI